MLALFQGERNDKIHAFYDGGYGFFFVSLANIELHFFFHILKKEGNSDFSIIDQQQQRRK